VSYYRRVGDEPRKRHSQFRDADGHLYTEELIGEEGFFHGSSLLYHRNLPNVLVAAEVIDVPALTSGTVPSLPLIPRKLQTHELPAGGDAVTGRHTILANDDLRVSYVVADRAGPLFRNALGDEIVFIEEGTATLETIYGHIDAAQGDYLVVPMGCVHRMVPTSGAVRLLVVEAAGHVRLPQRYLSEGARSSSMRPTPSATSAGPTSRCGSTRARQT
jgi:homogentisate 1,2-dioxygenase